MSDPDIGTMSEVAVRAELDRHHLESSLRWARQLERSDKRDRWLIPVLATCWLIIGGLGGGLVGFLLTRVGACIR